MYAYSLAFILLLGAQQSTSLPIETETGDTAEQKTKTNEFVEEVKKSIPHWPMSVKSKYVSVIPDQLPKPDTEGPEKNQLIQTRSTKILPPASPDLEAADYSIAYNGGKTISSDPNDPLFKFPELPTAEESKVQEFKDTSDEEQMLMTRALGAGPYMTVLENSINDVRSVQDTTNSIDTDEQTQDENSFANPAVISASLVPARAMQTGSTTNSQPSFSEIIDNLQISEDGKANVLKNAQADLEASPSSDSYLVQTPNSVERPTEIGTRQVGSANAQTGLDANKLPKVQTGLNLDPNQPPPLPSKLKEAQNGLNTEEKQTDIQTGPSKNQQLPNNSQTGPSKDQQLPNESQTSPKPAAGVGKVPNAETVQDVATQTGTGTNPSLLDATQSSGSKVSNAENVQVEPAMGVPTVQDAATQSSSGTNLPSEPTQSNGGNTPNTETVQVELTPGNPTVQDAEVQTETGFEGSAQNTEPFFQSSEDESSEGDMFPFPHPALLQKIFRLAGITPTPGRCAFVIISRRPIGSLQIPPPQLQIQNPIKNLFDAFRPVPSPPLLPPRFFAPQQAPDNAFFKPMPFQPEAYPFYPSQQQNFANPLSFLFRN